MRRPRCIEHQHRGLLRIRGHHLSGSSFSSAMPKGNLQGSIVYKQKRSNNRNVIYRQESSVNISWALGICLINIVGRKSDMRYLFGNLWSIKWYYTIDNDYFGGPPCLSDNMCLWSVFFSVCVNLVKMRDQCNAGPPKIIQRRFHEIQTIQHLSTQTLRLPETIH